MSGYWKQNRWKSSRAGNLHLAGSAFPVRAAPGLPILGSFGHLAVLSSHRTSRDDGLVLGRVSVRRSRPWRKGRRRYLISSYFEHYINYLIEGFEIMRACVRNRVSCESSLALARFHRKALLPVEGARQSGRSTMTPGSVCASQALVLRCPQPGRRRAWFGFRAIRWPAWAYLE